MSPLILRSLRIVMCLCLSSCLRLTPPVSLAHTSVPRIHVASLYCSVLSYVSTLRRTLWALPEGSDRMIVSCVRSCMISPIHYILLAFRFLPMSSNCGWVQVASDSRGSPHCSPPWASTYDCLPLSSTTGAYWQYDHSAVASSLELEQRSPLVAQLSNGFIQTCAPSYGPLVYK